MSLIDDLKPKMDEAIRNREPETEPEYTASELYYREIYSFIKKYIKNLVEGSMLNGNPPPDIKHYYYYKYDADSDCDYSVEELNEIQFETFDDSELLHMMRDKLEDYIKNKIGYKYCEVVLEDKIYKYDHEYKGLLGGKKQEVCSKPVKALWIHASMNKDGFSEVKSRGAKVRYDGYYSGRYDTGRFGNQKYKAVKESQKHS